MTYSFSPHQRGFTLFEVAISLVLVAFGVISVMMVYPIGIKAQLMARYQLLAAAKAEEMIESFTCTYNVSLATDVEGIGPWDVPTAYRPHTWDLESRVATHRNGVIPLPMDIARRLDSDGDEIQKILAQGGYLYYSQPMAATNILERAMGAAPPNETQKLVIAVSGFAQQNAIKIFPWKAWPYMMPYPSPPLHGLHRNEFLPPGAPTFSFTGLFSNCWEATSPGGSPTPGADADIRPVWDAYKAYNSDGNSSTEALAIAYLQAALWYCQRKGLTTTFYAPPIIPTPDLVPVFEPGTLDGQDDDFQHNAWKQVQAMRFLSHAATCLTKWRTRSGASPNLSTGVPIDSKDFTASMDQSPAITLTHDLIVYYHERCMNLIMRYAASFPYDWGAPRPLQRVQMMDFPLIEFDLFTPPQNGFLFEMNIGIGTRAVSQWKPIPARPIYNVGVSYQFPEQILPDASLPGPAYNSFWGNPVHSTLTKPFKAAERCRQIVFWAVDWQAYEDCETAPGAPVDASKYPIQGPLKGKNFSNRMSDGPFRDAHLFTYRNPEKVLSFNKDVSSMVTGNPVGGILGYDNVYDQGTGLNARKVFSGLFGADRNFNRILDRGPLPKSVRLKASLVARFNYYDSRLPSTLR